MAISKKRRRLVSNLLQAVKAKVTASELLRPKRGLGAAFTKAHRQLRVSLARAIVEEAIRVGKPDVEVQAAKQIASAIAPLHGRPPVKRSKLKRSRGRPSSVPDRQRMRAEVKAIQHCEVSAGKRKPTVLEALKRYVKKREPTLSDRCVKETAERYKKRLYDRA
jgi:hypothetical protein